jgi:hypothetical protein
MSDRRSWGILAARRIDEEPVDRAGLVENATERRFPQSPWTALENAPPTTAHKANSSIYT